MKYKLSCLFKAINLTIRMVLEVEITRLKI